jgi:CubicO group peptidase (beta-lactamase class C family)
LPRLDPAKLNRAFAVVEEGVRRGAYAGAVAAVAGADGLLSVQAFGHAALEPEIVAMQPDTLFDLASLTKVVAATPALLRLLEEGAFVLETPVCQIIPAFADKRVTMRHLMTHTSGLPAWQALYLDHRGWEAYTAAIAATPLVRDPGTQVEYSDLGFMLLGAVIQRLTGLTLPEYCKRYVFEPLGMSATGWLPQTPLQRVAATETGNATEYGMCKERAAAFDRWRQHVLWGEANDGNCWYGLDGVSSHAGLFGTAADLARYAAAWLQGGGPMLGRHTVAVATRGYTPGMAEHRALGWQKPPAAAFPNGRASCGDMLSPEAYGHTGFTGTSLWIDPEKDLAVILLTNRLHPAMREGLFHTRPAFHNAVVAAIL